MVRLTARVLVPGTCEASILCSERPLSFWGGVDVRTGVIIDRRHDRCGVSLAGRAFVVPGEKGSSTGSAVLLELIRIDRAPAAILSVQETPVLALGSIVADELYSRSIPVLVIAAADLGAFTDGDRLEIRPDGVLTIRRHQEGEG